MRQTRCAGARRRTAAAGAIVFLATSVLARGQVPAEGDRVVIQGNTFEVYPVEKLRARGLTVPEIPRERNAAWVYIEAINATVAAPEDLSDAYQSAQRGQWPEGEPGERLAAWLEQNRRAIELATRAASMPEYHMPLFRGDTDALIGALLPTLSGQRELARILSVEATYLAANGNGDDALQRCLTVQRMGHQAADGNMMIEGLVGLAIAGLAEQSFMRVADSGAADSDALTAATSELDALTATFPNWERMVRREQAWVSTAIDDMMDMGSMSALSGYVSPETPTAGPTAWNRLAARLRRVYLPDRTMKRHLRDHFDAVIENAKENEGRATHEVDEMAFYKRVPAWDVGVRVLAPSIFRAAELNCWGRSNFARARTALAIAAYRKDHGANPPSLAALTPKYLKRPPIDPMTGQVLDYAPPDKATGPIGVPFVTQKTEEDVRARRVPPTEQQRHATRWRRHVEEVCRRYELTEAQRASAEAILREIEDRANALGRKGEPGGQAGGEDAAARQQAQYDALFDELKRRVEELPTVEQRAAAKAKDREKP